MKATEFGDPRAGSHLVPLMRAFLATEGAVLEIGCGEWSTPVLRRLCLATGRKHVVVESDAEWAIKLGALLVDYDRFLPDVADLAWSVVLVDDWPDERRMLDARLFIGKAEHVLVHDVEHLRRKGTLEVPVGVRASVECDTLVLSRIDPPCA